MPSKSCIVADCGTYVEISAATLDDFDFFHVSSVLLERSFRFCPSSSYSPLVNGVSWRIEINGVCTCASASVECSISSIVSQNSISCVGADLSTEQNILVILTYIPPKMQSGWLWNITDCSATNIRWFDLLYVEFVVQEVLFHPLLVLNRLHSYNKDDSLFFWNQQEDASLRPHMWFNRIYGIL